MEPVRGLLRDCYQNSSISAFTPVRIPKLSNQNASNMKRKNSDFIISIEIIVKGAFLGTWISSKFYVLRKPIRTCSREELFFHLKTAVHEIHLHGHFEWSPTLYSTLSLLKTNRFFSFWLPHGTWTSRVWGFNLRCNRGNAGSWTYCAGLGTEPESQCSRDARCSSRCTTAGTPKKRRFWKTCTLSI